MKTAEHIIAQTFSKELYTQGFHAVPIFVMHCARSGFSMQQQLGYGYTSFLFHFEDGYGEMNYLRSDLERIWLILRGRLKEDARYLEKIKKRYHAQVRRQADVLRRIESRRLRDASEHNLLRVFHRCAAALRDSVGISHILEPLGLCLDEEFRAQLYKEIPDRREANAALVALTTPRTPSFLAKEESALRRILQAQGGEYAAKVERHARRYAWLQDSYLGPKKLSPQFFLRRLEALRKKRSLRRKRETFRSGALSPRVQAMGEQLRYTAQWQDERKEWILQMLHCYGTVMLEIARRLQVQPELLYAFSPLEVQAVRSFSDIRRLEPELRERHNGVFFLQTGSKEYAASGVAYQRLRTRWELRNKADVGEHILYGATAQPGTAIGRARVCMNERMLGSVQKGDVLVASMTRPEFMPALQRAAAIVTDEGGITSHAAIVARELNIPAVIGTRHATRVLKSGMMVEVRANHGFVRILESR